MRSANATEEALRTDSDVYDELCARLDAAIGAAFGIDPAAFKDPAIKRADETVRAAESEGLLADGGRSIREALPHREFRAVTPIESSGCFTRLLGPAEAQEAFLAVHRAGGDVAAAI